MYSTRSEQHWDTVFPCYVSRSRTIDEMFCTAVSKAAARIAVVDRDVRITYSDLDRRVSALALGLSSRGVAPRDRVAVMLPNGWEAVLSVLAIARLGAIAVPIGVRLRRAEVGYMFSDCEPKALIYEAAFEAELPQPSDAGPEASMRFCVGPSATQAPAFASLLASEGTLATCPAVEDDTFGILYTSGTTGRPKGAMLTHLGAVHSCLHWAERLRLGGNESAILCIPWSQVAGLCGVVLPFLSLGGRLVVMREFKRREFLELAARESITHALLVPAMYGLCLLEPDLASFDLSHWRLGVYGSAPMPEATIRRFAEAVPHLVMCNAYGATETTSPATIMPPGEGIAHSDSIGKTVTCGEIRVMDERGNEVAPGETGELWIRGPMIVPGYWRNPEANTASFVAGFWKSGDIGSVDADGYVRIADRKKDMINRGGFKVYPAEVENVITDHPQTIEAAVVGRKDDILGERVVAFVRATDGRLGEAEIKAFCAERMADYKVPDRVVVDINPLPRNANGKIQKDELRAVAEQQR